jgi:hypothetical protein
MDFSARSMLRFQMESVASITESISAELRMRRGERLSAK